MSNTKNIHDAFINCGFTEQEAEKLVEFSKMNTNDIGDVTVKEAVECLEREMKKYGGFNDVR
jgi:hypothetical protein